MHINKKRFSSDVSRRNVKKKKKGRKKEDVVT